MPDIGSSINADNNADFPWVVDVCVFMTPVSYVGQWGPSTAGGATSTDTGMVNNGYIGPLGNRSVQTDEGNYYVTLGPGTWTIEIITYNDSSSGIYTVQLDGSTVGTIDGYNASVTKNVRGSVTGIVVATGGRKILKLLMATKNGSASFYNHFLATIQCKRTA